MQTHHRSIETIKHDAERQNEVAVIESAIKEETIAKEKPVE